MALTGAWFLERSFAWTSDFAPWPKAWFWHSLLDRKIVIFDEWFIAVGSELVAEEFLNESDLVANIVDGDWSVTWRLLEC